MVVAVIALIIIGKATAKKDISTLFATAEKGQFEILVTTTGDRPKSQLISEALK